MKKVVFIGVFVSLASFSFAQSGKRALNNAYSHYSNEYYDRAKEEIDKCIDFDDTKADAKTWIYRGNIYMMIEYMKPTKDSNIYKKYDGCAEVAYEAYMQALKIDPKDSPQGNMRISSARQGLRYCSNLLVDESYKAMNKAMGTKNQEDFDYAFQLAKKAYFANDTNGNAIYCLGLAAQLAGKMDDAKTYYLEMAKKKIRNVSIYKNLANIYREEGDMPNAVKTMEAGVPLFLHDTLFKATNDSNVTKNLTKNYVDYAEAYSIIMTLAGRSEEANEIREKALEKDPKNHTMLINTGVQLIDAKRYDEAMEYFKRVLDMNPNDMLANYNMGNCYYNKYVDKSNELNKIEDLDLYAKAKEEAEEILKPARPYLEKAHELDPKEVKTLIMLQRVYARSAGEEAKEKYKEVEEKLNELKKE
jgi:tetratricopeptide (TPR) repeat protein